MVACARVHFLPLREVAHGCPPHCVCDDLKMTPLRLLQVEDTEDDAALVSSALNRAGYDVFATPGRHRGSAAPRARRDRVGPGDRRLHHARLQRHQGARRSSASSIRDLPFIFVSGTIGEDTAVAAMRTGAHDYIMKGNLARLAPAVERELREAAVRRERQLANSARRVSRLSRLADRPAQPRAVPRSPAAGHPALASRRKGPGACC